MEANVIHVEVAVWRRTRNANVIRMSWGKMSEWYHFAIFYSFISDKKFKLKIERMRQISFLEPDGLSGKWQGCVEIHRTPQSHN